MSAEVIPIGAPSRTELWLRLRLAHSVLAHRPYTPATATAAINVLSGITTLPPRPGDAR